jgi:plasmid stabilization system protein ParE
MARIEVAAEVIDDLDRFLAHLVKHGAVDAGDRVDEILQAVGVLETSPMIGRPVRGDKRELVIGKGVRGYVALYRYLEDIDTVFILALRPQRESGFKH